MDPPPAAPPHHVNYADSVDSSPRSRNTDSWDDPLPPTTRLRLMCSYGGHIVPRPHDKSLCYVGGDTRIVVVDRHTSLADLSARLAKTFLNGRPFSLKYQLPSEELDSLISVTTDEDLDNMIDEYDRTTTAKQNGTSSSTTSSASNKQSRLRLFLFPLTPDSIQSMGPILDNLPVSKSSEDWFLNALNGASAMHSRGFSESSSVNCLLGLDDDGAANNLESNSRDVDASIPSNCKNGKQSSSAGRGQDVHSVTDSLMLENSSSFGSTSSSPLLANLPPIRVHVEVGEGSSGGIRLQQDQKMGVEEQFAQMTIGGGGGVGQRKQDDGGGFVVLSSPPPLPTTIVATAAPMSTAAADYLNRVVSDDERSDQGVPVGYRRPPPPQPQPKSSGALDLASPDSVASDNSLSNLPSRPKPVIYHDPVVQIPSGGSRSPSNLVDLKLNMSDSNTRVQLQQQQVLDSGHLLHAQFDHQQLQQQQNHQQQQHHHQQQFINAGTHYIQHHPGSFPIPAYYPVYPPPQPQHPGMDQQHQQQYQVYYVPARQPQQQPYTNLPVQQQQSNVTEVATPIPPTSRSLTPPNPNPNPNPNPTMVPPSASYNQIRNAQIAKPEMAAAAGVYRTATTAAPPLVQVPSTQHPQQYVGYTTSIHHPSRSAVPSSGGAPNYAQIYQSQPPAPTMPSQYQTMTAAAAMVLPEVSAQVPTDNIKQKLQQR